MSRIKMTEAQQSFVAGIFDKGTKVVVAGFTPDAGGELVTLSAADKTARLVIEKVKLGDVLVVGDNGQLTRFVNEAAPKRNPSKTEMMNSGEF